MIHGHQPARIVEHKTSRFDEAETAGFERAAQAKGIDHLEMIWIQRHGAPRLFRDGQLPPLRGTALELEPDALVLYTRGMYVPSPVLLRPTRPLDLKAAATDVLPYRTGNAQLDERDPLTLRTAQRVGSILKHVPTGAAIATRYAFYM